MHITCKIAKVKGEVLADEEERLAFWVRWNRIQHRGFSKVSWGHLPKDEILSLHPEVLNTCQMMETSPALRLACTCMFTLLSDCIRSHLGACHLREPMTLPPSLPYTWKRFDLWLQRKPMSKLDFFRKYLGNTCFEQHSEPGAEGETKETSYLPFYTPWWRRQDRLTEKSLVAFCSLSLAS